MKASVYVVSGAAGWRAFCSVCGEMDRRFWTDGRFREGVMDGWGEARKKAGDWLPGGGGRSVLWRKERLPFGLAVRICERFNRQAQGNPRVDVRAAWVAAVRRVLEQAGVAAVEGKERLFKEREIKELEFRERGLKEQNFKERDLNERDLNERDLNERDLSERDLEELGFMARDIKELGFQELGSSDSVIGGQGLGNAGGCAENGADAREEGRRMGVLAREAAERLRGRLLLQAEAEAALSGAIPGLETLLPLLQLAHLLGGLRLAPGVGPDRDDWRSGRRFSRSNKSVLLLRCLRCGSGESGLRRTPCASCGRADCAYCEVCLTMGRSRECGLTIVGSPAELVPLRTSPRADLSRWGLSAAQSRAAGAALTFLRDRTFQADIRRSGVWNVVFRRTFLRKIFQREAAGRRAPSAFLIWAVTGAGKTEMIFPLLDAVLAAGGRAAVAAPRRDVVLELAPRLARAFPHASLTVLYGGSADRFEAGALTLATTHQLIRFREAFDLVVIDEVDAFPYHNDPMLHYAASQARSRGGVTVLLSATPPAGMQREARRGRLPHARVAVRHHRKPLPVPVRMTIPALSRWIAGGARGLPRRLAGAIRASADRGAQIFLFVPYVRQAQPLARLLRERAEELGLAPEAIEGTSSQDPERGRKVEAFRARTIRLLVTTTILERGVTVPRSDVFVLDADKPLFDASSLVQMAGRAGRSADDPDGRVYLAAPAWTRPQREACRQIREMNAYARRQGDLAR
jgi:late competence protein required for DNA uptake (superfamily II DNA/RNA helicase)